MHRANSPITQSTPEPTLLTLNVRGWNLLFPQFLDLIGIIIIHTVLSLLEALGGKTLEGGACITLLSGG